jgi:hypothetical protein
LQTPSLVEGIAIEKHAGLNFTVLGGFMLQPGAQRGHQVNPAAAADTRTHADGDGRASRSLRKSFDKNSGSRRTSSNPQNSLRLSDADNSAKK